MNRRYFDVSVFDLHAANSHYYIMEYVINNGFLTAADIFTLNTGYLKLDDERIEFCKMETPKTLYVIYFNPHLKDKHFTIEDLLRKFFSNNEGQNFIKGYGWGSFVDYSIAFRDEGEKDFTIWKHKGEYR